MPQLVRAGPLGERDLRHQPRAEPSARPCAAACPSCTATRPPRASSAGRAGRAAPTARSRCRPCRRTPGRRRRGTPSSSAPSATRDPSGSVQPTTTSSWPASHLNFSQPVGPAGGVRRVGPLGDQPLPALAARLGEVLLAAAAPVRRVADRPLEGEQVAQPALAVQQRLAAHVLAVGPEHVEDVEVDRHPAATRLLRAVQVDPRLQPGERRPRALERHHLAVDDEVGRRLLLQRLGDLGERDGDVAARPRVQLRAATGRGPPGSAGRRACARRPSRPPRTARGSASPAPAAGTSGRSRLGNVPRSALVGLP